MTPTKLIHYYLLKRQIIIRSSSRNGQKRVNNTIGDVSNNQSEVLLHGDITLHYPQRNSITCYRHTIAQIRVRSIHYTAWQQLAMQACAGTPVLLIAILPQYT